MQRFSVDNRSFTLASSRITNFLLDCGAKISLILTSANYRQCPLVQSVLKFTCKVTIKLPVAINNLIVLSQYEELVREIHCALREQSRNQEFFRTVEYCSN